jgi:hypothetical protein
MAAWFEQRGYMLRLAYGSQDGTETKRHSLS